MTFSPDGRVLVCFKNFRNQQPEPNLKFYDADTGVCLKEVTQSKSIAWKPQWTRDASICARFSQEEIHVYQNNKFSEAPSCKISVKNVHNFALAPRGPNPNIAFFSHGEKGQPSYVVIHSIEDGKDNGMVTRKSFFKADSVNLLWSDLGQDLLALACTNESQTSYYGDQILYFLSTAKGGCTANVQLPREGSILDMKFLPNSRLFAVCYGHLPATVTVFGTDCEPRFNFGNGPWNTILFSPLGNLVIFGGFGNIPGNVSIWDVNTKQKLTAVLCEDTTHISWLEDGQHFLVATTTPRLRVNNGFRLYSYQGEKLASWDVEKRAEPKLATADLPAQIFHELYHVLVNPLKKDWPDFKPKQGTIDPKVQALGKSTSASRAAAYVPPHIRNNKDDKNSGRKENPVGGKESTAKAASNDATKKIAALKTKLKQIEKLKSDRAAGSKLNPDQINKIKSEKDVLQQLEQWTLKKS
ncbi:Eukaryotic translation initiation factor 2A [Cichlidogyrus casuarinus]|uniref:Eukaryotic translation initiation factor 2A n=1 Tax=Cichlidogyrus casuarinus TaxID=1844966 RepID=A0ABD2PLH8_9PLAT